MYFSKKWAQETQWGTKRVWQRGLREKSAELQLKQVTVHTNFRPRKPTRKSHASTSPRVVLRRAQTRNRPWRGSGLPPTAPAAAAGSPPSRYFFWHQCIRPDHAKKNGVKIVVSVHFSAEVKLELTRPSLQQWQPPACRQSSGCAFTPLCGHRKVSYIDSTFFCCSSAKAAV